MNALAVLYTAWSHSPTCRCLLCLQAAAMLPAEDEKARYVLSFRAWDESATTEKIMDSTVEALEGEIDRLKENGATDIYVHLDDREICIYAEGEWYPTEPIASHSAEAR